MRWVLRVPVVGRRADDKPLGAMTGFRPLLFCSFPFLS